MNYSPPPAGQALDTLGSPAALGLPDATCAPDVLAPRLAWWQRLALGAVGCGLAALLATATQLTPSPQGMGTHRQLGLPPCTIVQWYGRRCPSCGMTTSWAYLVRGRVLRAFGANAGGALLGLAAAAGVPWLWATALRGRWALAPPHETAVLVAGAAIAGVTLVDWSLRLAGVW